MLVVPFNIWVQNMRLATTDEEKQMVQYLLGELSEQEQDQFEEELSGDDQKFERFEIIQDALIDAYWEDDLSEDECRQFEKYFLNSPGLRHRVKLTRDIIEAIRAPHPTVQFLQAAASLVFKGTWLLLFAAFLPTTRRRSVERRLRKLPNMKFPLNFYLAGVGKKEWRPLLPVLFSGYVIWPCITVLLIGAILNILGVSGQAMTFGIVGGVGLSLTGAVVCGVTVSQVGATAGVVPLGTIFGVGYALLINKGGGMAPVLARVKETNILTVVLGNVASLVAPSAPIIIAMAFAIFTTSYLMANTDSSPTASSFKVQLGGAIKGMMIGGLATGLVVGLTQVMTKITSEAVALCLAFGMIGGVAFGIVIWWKTTSWKRGTVFGVFYSLMVCGMIFLAFGMMRGTFGGLVVSSMTHAMFHGTFFVLAYVVAERIAGRWAGCIASTLEGVGGYVGFIVVHHRLFLG